MSLQRKHGMTIEVWPEAETTNHRGDAVIAVDMTADPIIATCAMLPQRSSRAEVTGQQQIVVYRMIVKANLPDVGLWSRVRWQGRFFDVAAPPAYHHGTKLTRHWSVDLRERPEDGSEDGPDG